ncbi:hypothetical protein F5X68DRAFT_226878 [Plectosphaerella plurivora]|uniref:Protein CAP22 n=1 Tax=Plectosphaerella plurivora TaxID=936078 RepID=A0A9P8VP52_9PEZI|nr:hypothetical protein F5X68DRAFT_226878 [Plectosphaerella plurivora]
MRSALFLTAGLAAILPVLAEELNAADVPAACGTICGPIVTLTNTCDIDPNEKSSDNDKRRSIRMRATEDAEEATEANCICTNKSFDVAGVMALCASCIAQNMGKTEDTNKMMSQCAFPTMSYAPSTTTRVAGIQVQATKPASTSSPTATGTSDAGSVLAPAIAILGAGVMALAL